jgi:hypothetical protein
LKGIDYMANLKSGNMAIRYNSFSSSSIASLRDHLTSNRRKKAIKQEKENPVKRPAGKSKKNKLPRRT